MKSTVRPRPAARAWAPLIWATLACGALACASTPEAQTVPSAPAEAAPYDERSATGYPAPLAIADAVADFNRRAAANAIGATQPPLTADEVVAALNAQDEESSGLPPVAWAQARASATSGTLPAGAWLSFTTGTMGRNGQDTDAWWVDLSFGMTSDMPEAPGDPPWTVRVRTVHLRSRPSALPEGLGE